MNSRAVKRHMGLSSHYFENAQHFLELGEIEKSSEFLWGSISQSLKALAANKGIELRKHDDLKNYAWELSRETKDEGIWYAFLEAQNQHSNFYESGLSIEDIVRASEAIQSTLVKIEKLISQQKKEKIDG
jgi:hypothetical protein